MINIRRSHERRHVDRGWLDSNFTFSFADYHDPSQMGFRVLRVMNNDRIAPGKGFGPHAHRDMEILTYILEGHLLHRDSMGERHVIGPNEIQAMTAGSGVVHSEFNASETESVLLYQIWILPAAEDLEPSYQQIAFEPSEKRGRLRLLAGPERNGTEAMTVINQNARMYVAQLEPRDSVNYTLEPQRHAWVQVAKGGIELNGQTLSEGDGAAISNERELAVTGLGENGGELLLFDLP